MTRIDREFEYVIVGGGSAGCVLANRLSEDPSVTVCLLEAGPPDTNPLIHIPAGMLWLMRSKVLNWQFHTQPEAALAGRRLYWPRGRTLGGSSAINAMCYTRGHASDYDAWAQAGNPGWSFKDVLPYFKRAEDNANGASAFHGAGGPLHVTTFPSPSPITQAYIAAGVQAGFPLNHDFNGAEQEGVGVYQVTQKRGLRWSAARAYLGPARQRPNLTILTRAHAHRVLLTGQRATGVRFQHGSQVRELTARREVLLCAGAVQSPQLLMLSGIGPAAHLRAHGIEVQVDLPGVGQNLQDHLDVMVTHEGRRALSNGLTWRNIVKGPWALLQLLLAGKGMLTNNGAEGCGFIKSAPTEPIPDLQFHFMPARLRDHGRDLGFMTKEGFSMHVCFLRPHSRGQITLHSADPHAPPRIEANYLDHPEDIDKLVLGIRQIRRIFASPAMDADRGAEITPGPAVQTDAQLREHIRAHAETIYHPVGTCKMGDDASDPSHVVDSALRVHGVQGLRVVDASVMPTLIGGNTNAPVIMMAEKAADLIRAAAVH